MYTILLPLHSLIRWLVLISLIAGVCMAFRGWFTKKEFSRADNRIRHWTATIAHIQLMIGIGLYLVSPITDYFTDHFKEAVHMRDIRFFGMEHSLMMLIGVTVITLGSAKAKRKPADTEKFRTMAIWFSVGLLIILSSIPWSFSPFTSRPLIRAF